MNKGLILGTLAVAILAMKSKKKVKVSGDATTPLTDYNLINNIAYSGATSVNGAFPADMAGGYVNPSFDNAIPNSAFAVYRDNSDIFTDKLNLLDGSKYSGAKSLYGVSADEIGNVMQYLDQRFKTEGKNASAEGDRRTVFCG